MSAIIGDPDLNQRCAERAEDGGDRARKLVRRVRRKARHTETLARDISVNEVNKEGLEKGPLEAVTMRIGAWAAGNGERENTGQWCVRGSRPPLRWQHLVVS